MEAVFHSTPVSPWYFAVREGWIFTASGQSEGLVVVMDEAEEEAEAKRLTSCRLTMRLTGRTLSVAEPGLMGDEYRGIGGAMKIPPDLVGEISQLYQTVKRLTVDVLSECHDPDYEATQENVRRLFSRLEEAFQLRLFEESEPEAVGERVA